MGHARAIVVVLAALVCVPRLAAAQPAGGDALQEALNQIEVNAQAILDDTGDITAVQQEASVIQASVQTLPALVAGQSQSALDLVVRMREDAAALTHYASCANSEDSFEIGRWAAQVRDDVGYLRDELGLGP